MFGLDPLIRMNWIRDSALTAVSGGKHKSTHPARPGSHAWPSSKLSCLPKLNMSCCFNKSSQPPFKVHFATANGKHSALLHSHGVVCARRVHRQRHRRSLQRRPCGRRLSEALSHRVALSSVGACHAARWTTPCASHGGEAHCS